MTLQDWIEHEGRPISMRDLQRMWDAATYEGEPQYASWTPPSWAVEPPTTK